MKKMTEKEAWPYLAKMWDKGDDRSLIKGVYDYCLCHSIDTMKNFEMIDRFTSLGMKFKISEVIAQNSSEWPYMAPLTRAGARKRAAFCRRMAKACK